MELRGDMTRFGAEKSAGALRYGEATAEGKTDEEGAPEIAIVNLPSSSLRTSSSSSWLLAESEGAII